MPLSPEQEWTLVACGLIAHADGVLEDDEWTQALWLVDARLPQRDATEWVERLGDRAALLARMDELALPVPLFTEEILEKAWRMALADGEGSACEIDQHNALASRLGIDAATVTRWRATWSVRHASRAQLIAGFAALIANADGSISERERSAYETLISRLGVSSGELPGLRTKLKDPPDLMELVGGFTRLAPEDRRIALLRLVAIVHADDDGEAARTAFIDLAVRIAVSQQEAVRMLERPR